MAAGAMAAPGGRDGLGQRVIRRMRLGAALGWALGAAVAALVPLAARAEAPAGAYLAARIADRNDDYAAAARYYARAVAADPANRELVEGALVAFIGAGRMSQAVTVAKAMIARGDQGQLPILVLVADDFRAGRYAEALKGLEQGEGFSPLLEGLARGWALFGAGRVTEALAAFDALGEQGGPLATYGQAHKGLALALVGDFEGAERAFAGEGGSRSNRVDRQTLIAHVEVLVQLGRRDEALALLDEALRGRTDPELSAIAARIRAGEDLPFDVIADAREGVAEVFRTIAEALSRESDTRLPLIYARLGAYIAPERSDLKLTVAELLERAGRHELAIAAYEAIPADDPLAWRAQMGRALALFEAGRRDEAIAALRKAAEASPGNAELWSSLGDLLRRTERFAEAAEAYSRAIELIGQPERRHWFLFYVRGIAYERSGRWEEAERDFRKALELEPDQPNVLNYLGYSLVEKGIKLDEALEMIRKAVEKRPNDGYITDSLGWALYRLGRYEEAVEPMERAVELTPLDPVINDHLGDVYWMVGRKREARFQWKRALSFGPDEKDAARIRRKLEVGLDKVLEEERAGGGGN